MLKYIKIWFYFTKEIFYYSYSLLFKNIRLFVVVFLVTSIALYGANMKWVQFVWGISVSVYIWYVFITELLMMNRNDKNITNDVKSGNIVVFLNKPIHYLAYLLSMSFFTSLIKISIMSIFWVLVIYLFTWFFPWFGFLNLLLFIVSMLVWLLMLWVFSIFFWLFAFVFEDSSFLRLMVNKCYFILWWVFFPVTIYPVWFQDIIKYLPFQYFFYAPAKFFVTWDIGFFISYFWIQVAWCGILILMAYVSYNVLIKRLELNGW